MFKYLIFGNVKRYVGSKIHLEIKHIFRRKNYAPFMSVVKICPKANDVYSHSVTLFKCGGTGWTRTSLKFVTIPKEKEKCWFCQNKTGIFLEKRKRLSFFRKSPNKR